MEGFEGTRKEFNAYLVEKHKSKDSVDSSKIVGRMMYDIKVCGLSVNFSDGKKVEIHKIIQQQNNGL